MKTVIQCLIFFVAGVVAPAAVHIKNFSSATITADSVPILTMGSLDATYSSNELYIQTPTRTVTVSVLDEAHVFVDDVGVTVTIPLSSHLEVLMMGFWAGLSAELFGLMLRVLRATKSQIGEVV